MSLDDFQASMPFWIETDGYSKRDREMFVCGAEFMIVFSLVRDGWRGVRRIHNENQSRIRMMLGRLRIPYEMRRIDANWTELEIL